jgi:hypothetical protein
MTLPMKMMDHAVDYVLKLLLIILLVDVIVLLAWNVLKTFYMKMMDLVVVSVLRLLLNINILVIQKINVL